LKGELLFDGFQKDPNEIIIQNFLRSNTFRKKTSERVENSFEHISNPDNILKENKMKVSDKKV